MPANNESPSPAPWKATYRTSKTWSISRLVSEGKRSVRYIKYISDNMSKADAEFCAIARNAYQIMTGCDWSPESFHETEAFDSTLAWRLSDKTVSKIAVSLPRREGKNLDETKVRFADWAHKQAEPDPFTAIVKARAYLDALLAYVDASKVDAIR